MFTEGQTKFCYGIAMGNRRDEISDCQLESKADCPYEFRLNIGRFCIHPRNRDYTCMKNQSRIPLVL